MSGNDGVHPRVAKLPRLRQAEWAVVGAATTSVVWEALVRLGPLRGWPGGSPITYTLLPAAVTAIALVVAAERPEGLRTPVVLTTIAVQAVAMLTIHRFLGPDDAEISILYANYGHQLLRTGRFPVAEYPPLALILLAVATWLGPPPVSLPLLVLPVLIAGLWAITRLGRWGPWAAAAALLWPTVLAYWEFRFDAFAAGLLALGILAALRHRWGLSGALLALGALAKWYPGLALFPLVIGLIRQRKLRSVLQLTGVALGLIVATSLWFVATGQTEALLNPYRFQGGRQITGESLPYTVLRLLGGANTSGFPWDPVVASPRWSLVAVVVQVAALAALAIWVWRKPANQLKAAVLAPVIALATNRVFSAQFNLLVMVALGCGLALVELDERTRKRTVVALGLMAVTNYAVFPGNVSYWFGCKVVYWVMATVLVVTIIRTPEPRST